MGDLASPIQRGASTYEDVGHFGVSCVCKEVGDEEI